MKGIYVRMIITEGCVWNKVSGSSRLKSEKHNSLLCVADRLHGVDNNWRLCRAKMDGWVEGKKKGYMDTYYFIIPNVLWNFDAVVIRSQHAPVCMLHCVWSCISGHEEKESCWVFLCAYVYLFACFSSKISWHVWNITDCHYIGNGTNSFLPLSHSSPKATVNLLLFLRF